MVRVEPKQKHDKLASGKVGGRLPSFATRRLASGWADLLAGGLTLSYVLYYIMVHYIIV